jgi:hypothetical protein
VCGLGPCGLGRDRLSASALRRSPLCRRTPSPNGLGRNWRRLRLLVRAGCRWAGRYRRLRRSVDLDPQQRATVWRVRRLVLFLDHIPGIVGGGRSPNPRPSHPALAGRVKIARRASAPPEGEAQASRRGRGVRTLPRGARGGCANRPYRAATPSLRGERLRREAPPVLRGTSRRSRAAAHVVGGSDETVTVSPESRWRPSCCVLGRPRTCPVRGLPASLHRQPPARPGDEHRSAKPS